MERIKRTLRHDATRVKQYILSFLKWTLIAVVTGVIGGVLGTGFRIAISYVTDIRLDHPWLCYLLPAGGVAIAFLYRVTKLSGHADTNLIINSVRTDEKVPILLAPVIFLSTVITHLFGGSAGREGAALQLGGCIGSFIGRVVRLGEKDMHIAVMCGMSGLFSALFGTPLTATVFAMEVISVGIIYYSAFLPCIVSALSAFAMTRVFGLEGISYSLEDVPKLNLVSVLTVAALGLAAALVSIVFCLMLEKTHHYAAKYFKNEYLRTAVGGAVALVMELLALAQAQLHLDAAVLEIQRQGDQRDAVLHDAGLEFQYFPLVHQQALGAHGVTVKDVAVLVGADVHAAGEKLTVFDGAEGVLEVYLPGADRLDLGPEKLDPGLKALEHEIFMKRLAVGCDLLGSRLLRHAAHFLSRNRAYYNTES